MLPYVTQYRPLYVRIAWGLHGVLHRYNDCIDDPETKFPILSWRWAKLLELYGWKFVTHGEPLPVVTGADTLLVDTPIIVIRRACREWLNN